MRSLWGFPEVQLGAFLAPGGYLLAVLISYAKRNSNVHHPKVFVAPKKSYAKRQIRNDLFCKLTPPDRGGNA